MPTQPIRQRYVDQVKLDATGAGSIEFTMKADFLLTQTTWKVTGVNGAKPTKQATAVNTINGEDWEGTYSGNQDSSGSMHLLITSDILRCQWTGGDANATAQLTLRGVEYPAGTGMQLYQAGGAGGPPVAGSAGPSNPILGGTTLIRDAIQSSNFQTGVSGWQIATSGTAEFYAAIIRGTLSADGGNVLVNDSGLFVTGSQQKVSIIDSGLYVEELPLNGGRVIIAGAPGFGGIMFLQPENSTVGGILFVPAQIYAARDETLTASRPYLKLVSPAIDSTPDLHTAQLILHGQISSSGTDDSYAEINASEFRLNSAKFSRPNVVGTFSQNIPTGAVTQINTVTAVQDSYGILNTSAFVLPRAGTWEIGITGRWASNATGQRQLRMQLNGVDYYYMPEATAVAGTLQGQLMVIRDTFAAADQINFQAFQNSGGNLVIGNGARCWAELIEG